jgi:hypothetical protein
MVDRKCCDFQRLNLKARIHGFLSLALHAKCRYLKDQFLLARNFLRQALRLSHELLLFGVDYTRILDGQFACAFHCRMLSQCHFQCQKLKNFIINALDSETRIQTSHPKRKCNRPLNLKCKHFVMSDAFLSFWRFFENILWPLRDHKIYKIFISSVIAFFITVTISERERERERVFYNLHFTVCARFCRFPSDRGLGVRRLHPPARPRPPRGQHAR